MPLLVSLLCLFTVLHKNPGLPNCLDYLCCCYCCDMPCMLLFFPFPSIYFFTGLTRSLQTFLAGLFLIYFFRRFFKRKEVTPETKKENKISQKINKKEIFPVWSSECCYILLPWNLQCVYFMLDLLLDLFHWCLSWKNIVWFIFIV